MFFSAKKDRYLQMANGQYECASRKNHAKSRFQLGLLEVLLGFIRGPLHDDVWGFLTLISMAYFRSILQRRVAAKQLKLGGLHVRFKCSSSLRITTKRNFENHTRDAKSYVSKQ